MGKKHIHRYLRRSTSVVDPRNDLSQNNGWGSTEESWKKRADCIILRGKPSFRKAHDNIMGHASTNESL